MLGNPSAVSCLRLLTLLPGCKTGTIGVHGSPGQVYDEARTANRPASSFPAADEDYFHDMDGGIPLTPEEVKGRNTWIVWTAGNDRMWDFLTETSVGNLDFLKTISSSSRSQSQPRQSLGVSRPGQRAVHGQSYGSRPEAIWSLARSS